VRWPVDFFPGIRVWASAHRGGSVVETATLPTEPVLAGGRLREFEFDAGVLPPGPGAPAGVGSQPVTLHRLLLEGLRRRGRIDDQGHRRAEVHELLWLTFPHGVPQGVAGATHRALEAAVADGDLHRDGEEYVAVVARTAPPTQVPTPWGSGVDLRPRLARRPHRVRFHFRRLPKSQWAPDERRAEYRRLIAEHGLQGVGRPELPRGYTFVVQHLRGRDDTISWRP
jgi:hypothetical protein